ELGAEHPQPEHVEEQVVEVGVQERIGDDLPRPELAADRPELEGRQQPGPEQLAEEEDRNVGEQERLRGGKQRWHAVFRGAAGVESRAYGKLASFRLLPWPRWRNW